MAEILHEFHRRRADISYYPIVGSGPNSCVLHYRDNNRQLQDGELLLIDAGCEFDYYASDVTRTFPVGGRYSRRQRAVYEVVLEAQQAAIAKVRAGAHWNEPHDAAVRAITQGLVRLGLLKGRVPKLIKDGAYRRFFMHRVGHWLGMDVHDVGEYKVGDRWRLLEPGMVTTIEPGIYIPPGSKGVRREWWGIGVRIEDDVVVTDGKPEVLTAGMPTDPDEIESLMARRMSVQQSLRLRRGHCRRRHGGTVARRSARRAAARRCGGRARGARRGRAAEFRRAHDGPLGWQPSRARGHRRLGGGRGGGDADPAHSRVGARRLRHRPPDGGGAGGRIARLHRREPVARPSRCARGWVSSGGSAYATRVSRLSPRVAARSTSRPTAATRWRRAWWSPQTGHSRRCVPRSA